MNGRKLWEAGGYRHGWHKQRPIVTFAWCVNCWISRNLALRLIALGYNKVYWYRGGWEAWDAHDLPKAPPAVQFQRRVDLGS
jgi:rhodanese-related sulfurtransferase